jgi:hypothetical protein
VRKMEIRSQEMERQTSCKWNAGGLDVVLEQSSAIWQQAEVTCDVVATTLHPGTLLAYEGEHQPSWGWVSIWCTQTASAPVEITSLDVTKGSAKASGHLYTCQHLLGVSRVAKAVLYRRWKSLSVRKSW